MGCLILFKSITYAQKGAVHLKNSGISSYLIRTPVSLSGGGCGYSLKVKCFETEKAKRILEEKNIAYISSYKSAD